MDPLDDRKPLPHAVEAERALLGGLISEAAQLQEVMEVLQPSDFYRPEHGALYQLLLEMNASGASIDLITVGERVSRGGQGDRYGSVAYVSELPEQVPSTANLRHYAEVVREKAVLREFIKTTSELLRDAHFQTDEVGTLVERAAKEMATLGQGRGERSWQPISLIVDEEFARIETLEKKGGSVAGWVTGFTDLDTKLAGLNPSDLLILAARPAMGKTALALNIAQNVATLNERLGVGIFSMEMQRGQLVTRMLCCHALVDAGRVRTGDLDTQDWERLVDASEYLRTQQIHIDDTPNLSVTDVRARARRLKAHLERVGYGLGVVVVDYLQLMRGDDPRAPREQQISSISRGLKALAKDLHCPVIALSQLNRGVESRQDKRPLVSDLRESGAIEQDADVILFIYRDEYYNPDSPDPGVAEVIIAKQRNGPTGTVKLAFLGKYTRFDNYLNDTGLL